MVLNKVPELDGRASYTQEGPWRCLPPSPVMPALPLLPLVVKLGRVFGFLNGLWGSNSDSLGCFVHRRKQSRIRSPQMAFDCS